MASWLKAPFDAFRFKDVSSAKWCIHKWLRVLSTDQNELQDSLLSFPETNRSILPETVLCYTLQLDTRIKFRIFFLFCLVHCRMLHRVSLIDRTRGTGHKLKCIMFPLSIRKYFLQRQNWQFTQGGCGVSNLGGIEKPPVHGPGQVALV